MTLTPSKVNQGRPATQANAWFARPRQVASFSAAYRLAARPYRLSNVFGAAGRKQFATIHHAATATKTVRLQRVLFMFEQTSAAAVVSWELVKLTSATTPATGNPAITPAAADADTVEATCLALPTTAGTEGAVWSASAGSFGITGGAPTTFPPPMEPFVTLYQPGMDEAKRPTIRAGNLEGWAVVVDCSAAATITGYVVIEFTEE